LADGTGAQVLGYPGPSPWVEFRPRWVRSQTVVYQANRNGTFDIWYKDLDTGADYRLTKDATNESAPAPRPGTAGLVYVEYDNNVNTEGSADLRGRLVLIPDTTDVPLQHIYLTSDKLRCGEPDWDPSGTRLCFSMEDSLDLTRHLFTLDLSTANPQPVQITQGPSHDYAPRWSPDGAHIVFTSDRSARYGVWVVSPLGESKGITLVSFEDPGASVYTPAWTPDGMSILVSSDGRGGAGHIRSLWLITNLPVFPF
jgi:Tol biopolymer transport system component